MYFLINLFYYATEESNFLIQENGIKFLSVDKSRDVLRCNLNVSIVIGEYSHRVLILKLRRCREKDVQHNVCVCVIVRRVV